MTRAFLVFVGVNVVVGLQLAALWFLRALAVESGIAYADDDLGLALSALVVAALLVFATLWERTRSVVLP